MEACLEHRTTPPAPLGAYTTRVSAFDLELSVSRDLLTVQGGVEQYLKLIEPPTGSFKRSHLFQYHFTHFLCGIG